MQQGRVTLDADHNEQADILLHMMRTLAGDLFGPYGGPAGGRGFELLVTVLPPFHLSISKGHYYVEGILVENDALRFCDYIDQPDRKPPIDDELLNFLRQPSNEKYLVYLDVWERHISWVEDDRIREVALGVGGPDTCTRARVVWQVKALPGDSCDGPLNGFVDLSDAKMAARLDQGVQINDSCIISPDARYRGAENQLYRVEIHQGNMDDQGKPIANVQPTFKWSRENGSVVAAWLDTDIHDLIVSSARSFEADSWVEISDDSYDLNGSPGVLVKLTAVTGDRLSIDPGTVPASGLIALIPGQHPKIRQWDQHENDFTTLVDGAVQISEKSATQATWGITLEDGIQVQFADGGQYRTGDYWLIPARVATGDIEWPKSDGSNPDPLPPRGVKHHYAPLGIVGNDSGNVRVFQSCRIGCNTCGQIPSTAIPNDISPAPNPSVKPAVPLGGNVKPKKVTAGQASPATGKQISKAKPRNVP